MALPEMRFDGEIIATLGERIALQRMVVKGDPRAVSSSSCTASGSSSSTPPGSSGTVILFDLDDRKLAFVEALDRFAAGEASGDGGRGAVRGLHPRVRGVRLGDGAPDAGAGLRLDDRRALGLGRLDRDQWIASMEGQAALGPGLAGEVRRVLAWNRHGLVVELRTYRAMWGADGASGAPMAPGTAAARSRSSSPSS